MGNKSKKRKPVRGQNVQPPPRSPNWIYTGRGRGYDFWNLDRLKDCRAEIGEDGVNLTICNVYEENYRIVGRAAEDMIAHLVMVGTDVTGAAEVLRDRFVQNIRENLETLHVLEEEHLEAFHRGEISTVAEDLRGDAGGGSCVICKCTESTPCEGNDGNPCHWIRPGALCSTCAEALEVIERLERGQIGEELLTPAERHVLELLDNAGYGPPARVATTLKEEFHLVHQVDRIDESLRRADDRSAAAAFELAAGGVVEIGGSSADRSSCPHGAAVADECKLFPRCHVCVRPKAKTFHDPATPCAHDEKEDCDDCNDCGGPTLETPPPLDGTEKPGCVWWNPKGERYELGIDLNWRHTPEGGATRKATNCLECLKIDRSSCTWSNGGPAPCPGFERDAAKTEDADREFIRRTEGDLIEERPATREELERGMKTCMVYVGLEKICSSAVPPKDPIKCRVGEEMNDPRCKVCPYYSEEGL